MNHHIFRKPKLARLVITCLAVCLLLATLSCSKKESAVQVQSSGPNLDFSKTLVSYIPTGASGFLYSNVAGQAMKKLLASPWKPAGEVPFIEQTPDEQLKKLLKGLTVKGYNLEKTDFWLSLFSESVFFTAPAPSSEQAQGFGMFAKAQDSMDLQKFFDALGGGLDSSGYQTTPEKYSAAKGFSFSMNVSLPSGGGIVPISNTLSVDNKNIEHKFYVAWDSTRFAVTTQTWVVDYLFTSEGGNVPDIVKSATYKKATEQSPPQQNSYFFGYMDPKQATKQILAQVEAPQQAAIDANGIPLQAISINSLMNNAPETAVRLLFDDSNQMTQQFLPLLQKSSSKALSGMMPQKLVAAFTLDGSTLQNAWKQASLFIPPEAAGPYSGALKLIDHLSRFGLAVRSAPVGMSMLPVPDLLLVLETKNTEQAWGILDSTLATLGQQMGGGTLMQSERDIAGHKTKVLASPLGLGIYATKKDNVLLISSAEPLLNEVLSGDKLFATQLPPRMQQSYEKQETLLNVFVNFEQVAGLLESMGGTLSMFAPQAKDMGFMFDPKNIQAMKSKGIYHASVDVNGGIIDFISYYAPGAVQVAAAN